MGIHTIWHKIVKTAHIKSAILNTGFFFFLNENDLDYGVLWANLDQIFMQYQIVSLIDQLLVTFLPAVPTFFMMSPIRRIARKEISLSFLGRAVSPPIKRGMTR